MTPAEKAKARRRRDGALSGVVGGGAMSADELDKAVAALDAEQAGAAPLNTCPRCGDATGNPCNGHCTPTLCARRHDAPQQPAAGEPSDYTLHICGPCFLALRRRAREDSGRRPLLAFRR